MTLRTTLALLLCLLMLGAGATAVLSYRHMAERIAGLEAQASELAALKQSVSALNAEAAKRAVSDNRIRTERATTVDAVEKASNESPTLSGYLHERIPDGLREAHLRGRSVPGTDPN